jgi:predicted nuclease of predicted toxin-antitoxin system
MQLQSRGIDAVSVRDLQLLGADDEVHLRHATNLGRVVVTSDSDFLRLAASGIEHAGIIYLW